MTSTDLRPDSPPTTTMAHLLGGGGGGEDDEEALLMLPPPPPPPSSGTSPSHNYDYNGMPGLEQSPKSADTLLLDDDDDDASYDEESDIEYADATMETPLAAHISHKRAPHVDRVHRIVFKNHQQQSYGAISERSGDFCSDHDRNYSQDTDDDDDDDDDRSLSSRSSLSSITTIVVENFREGLAIPFVDPHGNNICRGLSSLAVVGLVLGIVLPNDPNLHGQWYPWYKWISNIIGYTYFVLWSVCFYPQVLLNARRRSTRGLSNDFAILNFFGWLYYSAYQSAMYFGHEIQQLYAERFANEKSTVHLNDVAFAVHAMTLSFWYLVQIVYYGDSTQKSCYSRLKLKPSTWFLVLGMGLPSVIVPVMIVFQWIRYDRWLDYFYMLSWFKICCTVTKYSKQVWLNWNRKSTSGWNIWYNFLECTGGALSMVQIVLDSWDMQDMSGITGNMAKFALGLATIGFDAIFYTQHYVLYPESSGYSKPDVPGFIKTSSRLRLSSIETHHTEDTN